MRRKTFLFRTTIGITAITAAHLLYTATHGYYVVKWYTPLLVYTSGLVIAIFLWMLAARVLKVSEGVAQKVMLLAGSICFTICLAEIVLRSMGTFSTYTEKRLGFYTSPFRAQEKNWFHIWTPFYSYNLQSPEFNFPRTANSLGFSDIEPTTEKDSGEVRIFTLGDSFTEGDGAPFDSSYPQQLKAMLAQAFPSVKFSLINAGVSGNDPYFNYIDLRERLIKYKPDVVLVTTGTGDLFDIYFRGGMERFRADGTVKYKTPPWWEPVFVISYISRLVINKYYYEGGISREGQRAIYKKSALELRPLFASFDSLGRANNFQTVILLRPEIRKRWQDSFSFSLNALHPDSIKHPALRVFNLLSFYKEQVAADSLANYFWKFDSHHNSKGYHLMANGAFNAIKPIIDSAVEKKTFNTAGINSPQSKK